MKSWVLHEKLGTAIIEKLGTARYGKLDTARYGKLGGAWEQAISDKMFAILDAQANV